MRSRGNFWLKAADRYLGIPCLLSLSLFKSKGEKAGGDKSVLAIKVGTIGDTLLLLPVLKAIKEKSGSLHVIASPNNVEVLRRYDFIDSISIFDVSKAIKDPFYFIGFLKKVNSVSYGFVADFEPWPRVTSILSLLIRTGIKAGFKTRGQHRHSAYNITVDHRGDVHETENYRALAASFGVRAEKGALDFPVYENEKTPVEDALKRLGIERGRLILFHPWSSGYKGSFKEWGNESFGALARYLTEKGYVIGITGTKNDAARADEIVRLGGENVFSFCGKFTLGQTAWLIKNSRLIVAVNTGIMHLASVAGCRMVVLDGPAGELRWGPIGRGKARILKSDYPCSPCLNLGFEYKCKAGGCMQAIKVEQVFSAIIQSLNGMENVSHA